VPVVTETKWLNETLLDGIPARPPKSVVERAEIFMRLPGSAMSTRFDCSRTPWLREPIECSGDGVTRKCTLIKPIQAGGSVAGEVILCDRLIYQSSGDVQYNWPNNNKAKDRWTKRVEPILLAIREIRTRAALDKNKWMKGLIAFPHLNLTMQGVFTNSAVASDAIRCQINEELHDNAGGWFPGRLQQAYGRLTAYWDSYVMNISNASHIGDDLEAAFLSGTQQHWEVRCPGCQQYHELHSRWDKHRPDLGGLRYDSTGCKLPDYAYDYNRLKGTIRFVMPCGYELRDDRREREQLASTGRYGQPKNQGAMSTERSYSLEAVALPYIPFVELVQERHRALKALRYGDASKFCAYVRERECRFYDTNDRPLMDTILLSPTKKNRDGLQGRHGRYFAIDRQRGSVARGEVPYWYLVIRDAADSGASMLIYEGRLESDEDVIKCLQEHECIMRHGVADSGDDTAHVYQFCLRYGINAIKGSSQATFSHGVEGKKIFSQERPLWRMRNLPGPTRDDPLDEPQFWFYSRLGTMDRLRWLQTPAAGGEVKPKWEVPSDVSEEYQRHMEAWDREQDGKWVQVRKRDEAFKCETYIAMLMEMAEIIGAEATDL